MEKDYEIIYENEYRIVWVNSDYEIHETYVEAENKKKAIIKFFIEISSKDVKHDVENFKIKRL